MPSIPSKRLSKPILQRALEISQLPVELCVESLLELAEVIVQAPIDQLGLFAEMFLQGFAAQLRLDEGNPFVERFPEDVRCHTRRGWVV